jgi:hypothetical protein
MTGTASNDARGLGVGAPPQDPAPSAPEAAHLAHTGMVRISPDPSGTASFSTTTEHEAACECRDPHAAATSGE